MGAPINLSAILDPKTGFNIGWDYGSYHLVPPETASCHKTFMDGYEEARKRIKPMHHDRFIRKHLMLRLNAWLRGRTFDESVTPAFIKRIDVKRCPVTGEMLTHGTGELSDWSVDRVNNDGGYAPGNLVVVSTRANMAKGSKSFSQITAAGLAETPTDGLSPFEWQRWTLIASLARAKVDEGVFRMGYAVAPCVIPPPPCMVLNPSCIMQLAILYRGIGDPVMGHAYKIMADRLDKTERRAINEVLNEATKRIRHTRSIYPIWHNQKLFSMFEQAFSVIDIHRKFDAMDTACRAMRMRIGGEISDDTWHFSTRGYATA